MDALGRFRKFALLLGPLRRLLFFRRQGGFFLIFPLIFDFFGHGIAPNICGGWVSGQRMIRRRCRAACPQALLSIVYQSTLSGVIEN